MTSSNELRQAERRAATRSLAVVLVVLLGVALVGTWTSDVAAVPGATDVLGAGYGRHLVTRDDLDGAVAALATVLYSLPALLLAATALAAWAVADQPDRRRCRALAGLGWASAVGLLVVLLGIVVTDDLVGVGTPLLLGLAGSVAAGGLGARAAAARLHP